jgi:hypothetical protein
VEYGYKESLSPAPITEHCVAYFQLKGVDTDYRGNTCMLVFPSHLKTLAEENDSNFVQTVEYRQEASRYRLLL